MLEVLGAGVFVGLVWVGFKTAQLRDKTKGGNGDWCITMPRWVDDLDEQAEPSARLLESPEGEGDSGGNKTS